MQLTQDEFRECAQLLLAATTDVKRLQTSDDPARRYHLALAIMENTAGLQAILRQALMNWTPPDRSYPAHPIEGTPIPPG